MALVNMKEMLADASKRGYAVGMFDARMGESSSL